MLFINDLMPTAVADSDPRTHFGVRWLGTAFCPPRPIAKPKAVPSHRTPMRAGRRSGLSQLVKLDLVGYGRQSCCIGMGFPGLAKTVSFYDCKQRTTYDRPMRISGE